MNLIGDIYIHKHVFPFTQVRVEVSHEDDGDVGAKCQVKINMDISTLGDDESMIMERGAATWFGRKTPFKYHHYLKARTSLHLSQSSIFKARL